MFGEKFCLKDHYPVDQEIIRFLSFEKFIDLLSSKELYLSRGDRFVEDTYEGIETACGKKLRRIVHNDHNFETNSKLYERNRRCVAVCCWFVGKQETVSMWKRYAGDIDGIAIRTNVKYLKSTLNHFERHLCVRKIEYVDNHDNEMTRFGCPFYPFSIKRKSQFAYENELRIIYGQGKGCVEKSPLYEAPEISSNGVRIPIKLSVLIEKIIVSPRSTPLVFDKVLNIVKNCGLDSSVVARSDLI